jgi:hypothetical protein
MMVATMMVMTMTMRRRRRRRRRIAKYLRETRYSTSPLSFSSLTLQPQRRNCDGTQGLINRRYDEWECFEDVSPPSVSVLSLFFFSL